MTDIIISEYMDGAAVADLKQSFDVVYDPDLVDDLPRLLSLLPEARALVVRNRTQVNDAMMAAGPNLKVIGRLGVGLDNIDLAAADARGVPVCPAYGANADSVAEYVMATMLILKRPVFNALPAMLAGEFPRPALSHGAELGGSVLTIIGGGVIGQSVMKRAIAMGMTAVIVDPQLPLGWNEGLEADVLSLEDGLRVGDAISLHVPLTDGTKNLIDAARLSLMKPSAVLINTARGGIIDHAALAASLTEGKLAGAAIDVFASEPASAEELACFIDVPNLILTPHVAGLTVDANTRVGAITAANIRNHLE